MSYDREGIKKFVIQTLLSSGHVASEIRDEIGVPPNVIRIALELRNNPIEIISKFNPSEIQFCRIKKNI